MYIINQTLNFEIAGEPMFYYRLRFQEEAILDYPALQTIFFRYICSHQFPTRGGKVIATMQKRWYIRQIFHIQLVECEFRFDNKNKSDEHFFNTMTRLSRILLRFFTLSMEIKHLYTAPRNNKTFAINLRFLFALLFLRTNIDDIYSTSQNID